MNDWYYLGLIPGIIGDIVGDSSEENVVLDGTNGDPNYQYNGTKDSREPIIVEENGITYVFNSRGEYVTEFPTSEKDNYRILPDKMNDSIIVSRADEPETSTSTSTSTMTPARDENGNLIYIDGNGNIVYPDSYVDEHGNTVNTQPDVDEEQEPVLDENGNWIFIDENGNPVNPNTFMDGNGNTIVVHPTTGEQFNVNEDNVDDDDDSEEYIVPILVPMVDASGKTYYVDENGNSVDGNGKPYTPVTKPTEEKTYVDELGNPIETPSNNNNVNNNVNINNNTNNNNVNNNTNNNINNNNTNNDIVIRDELGDVVVREPANTTNIRIINTQDGDDRDDDFWAKNNLTPPNNSNIDQNNTKKINYNSTIGKRAAYYAPWAQLRVYTVNKLIFFGKWMNNLIDLIHVMLVQ